jgi:hypothetical protein
VCSTQSGVKRIVLSCDGVQVRTRVTGWIQNIGNTLKKVFGAISSWRPWKKSGPVDQRIGFELKALRTDNFRASCAEYGISVKTGHKWRARLLGFGTEGTSEESRRPRGHAEQLSPEVVCEMVRASAKLPSIRYYRRCRSRFAAALWACVRQTSKTPAASCRLMVRAACPRVHWARRMQPAQVFLSAACSQTRCRRT